MHDKGNIKNMTVLSWPGHLSTVYTHINYHHKKTWNLGKLSRSRPSLTTPPTLAPAEPAVCLRVCSNNSWSELSLFSSDTAHGQHDVKLFFTTFQTNLLTDMSVMYYNSTATVLSSWGEVALVSSREPERCWNLLSSSLSNDRALGALECSSVPLFKLRWFVYGLSEHVPNNGTAQDSLVWAHAFSELLIFCWDCDW